MNVKLQAEEKMHEKENTDEMSYDTGGDIFTIEAIFLVSLVQIN